MNNNIVAAIDIGSSKIVGVLAKVLSLSEIEIIAFKEIPSKGVKNGGIVNMSLLQHSVENLLNELEEYGRYNIHSVICSLSGVSIIGYNVDGEQAIKGKVVTSEDIIGVIVSAKNISSLKNHKILHMIPQQYFIDKQSGINDPIGLSGENIKVLTHIIRVAKTSFINLKHIFSDRDIEVENAIFSGYASSLAVATPDEQRLGVCVLDIGAGTTEIIIYRNGKMHHSEVIPFAGNLITSDLAFFMRCSEDKAEQVKCEIDISKEYQSNEIIEVESIVESGSRKFYKKDLADVIKNRCDEIADIISQRLSRSGFEDAFSAGFIVCGGSANMKGINELFECKFNLPVRTAKVDVDIKLVEANPKYATILGLLMYSYSSDYTRTITKKAKRQGIISFLLNKFKN